MISQIEKEESVIQVSNLLKVYDGTKAVNGIDFVVERGSIFALLGPNGAGKTTTVRILEGLLKRNSGVVTVLGLDPWSEHEKLKVKIGVMPQEFNFFEKLTPLDSINFYSDLFQSTVDPERLLKLVILDDSKHVPFEKLSGGQKQKLGLALSLVNDPEVLFLDEPTTGLDPSARRAIWSIIRTFKEQGKTIVLTTHYMEEAEQLADQVAIINKGKIIASGSPDEIVSNYGSGRKLVIRADRKMLEYLRALNIEATGNGGSLEIILESDANLSELISIIEKSGIKYSQLTVRSDSLEDVFVKLVGEMSEGELR